MSNAFELLAIATSMYVASADPKIIAIIDTNMGKAHPHPITIPVIKEPIIDIGEPAKDNFFPLFIIKNMLIVNKIEDEIAIR